MILFVPQMNKVNMELSDVSNSKVEVVHQSTGNMKEDNSLNPTSKPEAAISMTIPTVSTEPVSEDSATHLDKESQVEARGAVEYIYVSNGEGDKELDFAVGKCCSLPPPNEFVHKLSENLV
jgi:hypothetical protein